MKPSEILKKGLELLETKGWTQGSYARNDRGETTEVVSASCFCGIGAIRVAAFKDVSIPLNAAPEYHIARQKLNDAVERVYGWVAWQDEPNRTFAEVKAKFLEAIKLAEDEEQVGTV